MCNNNGVFGGNCCWIIIVILLLIFCCGNGSGYGSTWNNGGCGCNTGSACC